MIMAVQSETGAIPEVDSVERPQCWACALDPMLFHASHDLADDQGCAHLLDHPETDMRPSGPSFEPLRAIALIQHQGLHVG